MNKHTGNTLLDKTINQLNKKFSKDLVTMGPTILRIPSISTGSLGLDLAIGIGGIPRGRIIEFYGDESSGKTSLALACANNARLYLPETKKILIVDAERAMTQDLLDGFGHVRGECLYVRPDTAEEAFQCTLDLVKTGEVGFVVFDSMDAIQTEAELEKDIGEHMVGGTSKMAAQFFRQYNKYVEACDATTIFINQVKANPGIKFGSKETTPGGSALKFYASLRLRMSPAKRSTSTKNAFKAKLKIKKNKCAAPVERDIEFDFIYARGPDPIIDAINTGKDLGVLAFGGQVLYILEDGKKTKLCDGGAPGFTALCEGEPDVLARVRQACLNANRVSEPLPDTETEPTEETDE